MFAVFIMFYNYNNSILMGEYAAHSLMGWMRWGW